MMSLPLLQTQLSRARDIDISRAERAKLRAEREIEEAQDKHLIDQERRAKIALQRAINRINVGINYKKMNLILKSSSFFYV